MEVRSPPRNFSWRAASRLCTVISVQPSRAVLGLWDSNDRDGRGGRMETGETESPAPSEGQAWP